MASSDLYVTQTGREHLLRHRQDIQEPGDPEGIWDLRVDRYFNFNAWRLILFLDIQNVLNKKIQTKPRYNFWEDDVIERNSIGILPSIGISAEF